MPTRPSRSLPPAASEAAPSRLPRALLLRRFEQRVGRRQQRFVQRSAAGHPGRDRLGFDQRRHGQRLENRIAAIERLATTDPGLDVGLLEAECWLRYRPRRSCPRPIPRRLATAIPAACRGHQCVRNGSTEQPPHSHRRELRRQPAAVPEPSTLLLAALGGLDWPLPSTAGDRLTDR